MTGKRLAFAASTVALVTLLAGAGSAGSRALSARDHLRTAQSLVQQLQRELLAMDPDAAAGTLGRLQRQTRAARADLSHPGVRIGAHLPMAGDDLAAARTVTAVLDDLAHDGLPQVVAAARLVRELGIGRDPGPLRRAAPGLARAELAFRRARATIGAIPRAGLAGPVRQAVLDLEDRLPDAVRLLGVAARTAALLPGLLGDSGPRTYLVLFQNLAEVRATGGMPGAFVVVRADHGRIRIADQGSATGLRPFARPVLPLSASDRQLWTDKPAVYPADVNLTPHFPTVARLAREMYRRRSGTTVDGVFATDPVALSYLLGALGPVPVPGGATLRADNAVRLLLSEIYAARNSARGQDAYFAAAARAVFQAVLRRPPEPLTLKDALVRAAAERRMLVWSAHEQENRLLDGTTLDGVLPERDGDRPAVGVFLNDGSGAKLGYYLTHSARLAVTPACRRDGRREMTLRVVLGSTAPRSGLSASVLGLGLAGDPYTTRTNVSVYSPAGGAVTGMRVDGAATSFGSGRDRRRAVGTVTLDVPAGGRRVLDVTLLSGSPGARVRPRLWLTPGVAPWAQLIDSGDICPASR
ncbi:DUF4012 domain-containing protein [Actinoplanes siamensis]|uniref:Chemotaxis protein n=1 Tax=Actinoplanes siamensis TaxID=1223317 RepID=A0A919N3N9_9ACTN|nr:DUF4012 domain-containing protein [Actinoplanes siamensis]GIF03795.1 chemotaxis protein [Actinoplanes siamensis]